jgi:hypothetical protein
MSGEYPAWAGAIAVFVTILFLGVRMRMLSVPEPWARCSACRRLYRRGTNCRCSRS